MSKRGRSGSGLDVLTEIAHTLSGGLFQADDDTPWTVTSSPFKCKDDVKAIFAEVVCEPTPLPELGEGAIWDNRSKRLLFLDILGCRLFRFDPNEPDSLEEHDLSKFSKSVSSVVPISESSDPTGDIVGITARDCFAIYNFKTRTAQMSTSLKSRVSANERFNDGKVDTMGRYWAGTIARDPKTNEPVHEGALYRRNLDGSVDQVLKDVAISNGLTWEQGTMYFTDTLTGQLDVLTYDEQTGAVKDRKACIEGFTFEETGLPDGHCTDNEGMLWVACFNGGMVRRFDPKTGELLAEAHVPAEGGRQVTSCAFGGDDLSELYITTAHEAMPASELESNGIPLAGALFKVTREKLQALGAVPGRSVSKWKSHSASSSCLSGTGCGIM